MTPGHRVRLLDLVVEGVKLGQLVWASETLVNRAAGMIFTPALWFDVRNLWNGGFWLPQDLMGRALDLLEALALRGHYGLGGGRVQVDYERKECEASRE